MRKERVPTNSAAHVPRLRLAPAEFTHARATWVTPSGTDRR